MFGNHGIPIYQTQNINVTTTTTCFEFAITNKRGKTLLLQRSGKSSFPGYWQLVEGKMEEGESPLATIKREVKEETNLEVKKAEFNNIFYNEIKVKKLKYLIFRIVFKTSTLPNTITISDEHKSFGWFDKGDVTKLTLLPGTKEILSKFNVSSP